MCLLTFDCCFFLVVGQCVSRRRRLLHLFPLSFIHFHSGTPFFFFSQATTRMEERLDDAINVLRNHAESMIGPQAGAGAPGQGPGPSPSLSHSNGIMAAYTPVLEPHMVKKRETKQSQTPCTTVNWNLNFSKFFCCLFCSP